LCLSLLHVGLQLLLGFVELACMLCDASYSCYDEDTSVGKPV